MKGDDDMITEVNIKTMHDAWLSRMKPSVERITAEMAREILAKNTNNRSLNNTTVQFYMEQMSRGHWQLNGESIKIASDGTLLDGQHRLEAISRLGGAFDTLVVRGVDKDTFATIDNGKTRSNADHMKISGMKHGKLGVMAAAARIVMKFTKDGRYQDSKRKWTPTEIIEFFETTEGRWLTESVELVPEGLTKLVPASLGAAMHYMLSCVDPSANEKFFYGLSTGAGLDEGSPILALRNRLISYNTERGSMGNSGVRQLISYFIQAFNAYREGRELKNLPYLAGKEVHIDGIR